MPSSCAFCGSKSLANKHSMRALYWKIPRGYYRCKQCLGFTLIPKLNPEELNELYSDYYLESSSKTEAFVHGGSENWMKKYMRTIKYVRTQKIDSKNFLDFGCGVDGVGALC